MIDKEITARLAELSGLEFTDSELSAITRDMTNIIELMDRVRGFDAEAEPHEPDAVTFTELRPDECRGSYPVGKILENAKVIKDDQFVVPKVVG